MKKFDFFGLLALLVMFTSCQTAVPMNAEYLNKPSKVGVMVVVNTPQKFREGSQGLLDLAITSGDKYQPLLDVAAKEINPKDELVKIYSESLKSKGKEVIIINEPFDAKTAEKFKGEKVEGKKYYNYDFGYLKDKYGIDEVLFVNMNYGVMVSYYSMIETGRTGYTYLADRIINLNDNSLYFANDNAQSVVIKGKWNVAPGYENAISKIKESVDKAVEVEKNIFK